VSDDIGPGRLLLIAVERGGADAAARAQRVLREHVPAADLRGLDLGGPAMLFLAYTDAAPAGVRDWLAEVLGPGAGAFVVEFEHWSALGGVADPAWLLQRGH
jgi:hypothetical protein